MGENDLEYTDRSTEAESSSSNSFAEEWQIQSKKIETLLEKNDHVGAHVEKMLAKFFNQVTEEDKEALKSFFRDEIINTEFKLTIKPENDQGNSTHFKFLIKDVNTNTTDYDYTETKGGMEIKLSSSIEKKPEDKSTMEDLTDIEKTKEIISIENIDSPTPLDPEKIYKFSQTTPLSFEVGNSIIQAQKNKNGVYFKVNEEEFGLTHSNTIHVGRDPQIMNGIILSDKTVSQNHVSFAVDEDLNLLVEEKGSTNGTVANALSQINVLSDGEITKKYKNEKNEKWPLNHKLTIEEIENRSSEFTRITTKSISPLLPIDVILTQRQNAEKERETKNDNQKGGFKSMLNRWLK